jgi:hypothetical protein
MQICVSIDTFEDFKSTNHGKWIRFNCLFVGTCLTFTCNAWLTSTHQGDIIQYKFGLVLMVVKKWTFKDKQVLVD